MRDRVIALAGLAQAVEAVLQIASDGYADELLLEPVLDSLFATDPPDTETVYGGLRRIRNGLQLLIAQFEGQGPRRSAANRIAITVLQVERKLVAQRALMDRLGAGIAQIAPARERSGSLDFDIQQQLGDLYSGTVSTLTPRVLVQGNPAQLGQSAVVARIRAALLAAVRAAVLWRQLGGSWWDLTLRRGAVLSTARRLLAELDGTS